MGGRRVRYKYISYKYMGKIAVENAFQGIWEAFGAWAAPAAAPWRPPTDVYETRNEIVVLMEIAAVPDDNLSVTLFSDHLVVEGTRPHPELSSIDTCHRLGINYGDFRSEIYIPAPVDHDKVSAEYHGGLLKITLKKQRL